MTLTLRAVRIVWNNVISRSKLQKDNKPNKVTRKKHCRKVELKILSYRKNNKQTTPHFPRTKTNEPKLSHRSVITMVFNQKVRMNVVFLKKTYIFKLT